jgi:aspartate 1-decarboxylase
MKTFISGKIQGITVTDKSIHYNGSVTVDLALLEKSGIEPYEQVWVANLNNGERFVTYTLPSTIKGIFTLNGGCARLGEVGDKCILLAYRMEEKFSGANVVFCNEDNSIKETMFYQMPENICH